MFLALQPFRPKIITDNAITSGQTGCSNMVSGGFSFSDGEQILVSAQKPLGMVLEQDTATGAIVVAEVDPSGPASRGGVRAGDVLVAVQNASTEKVDLDSVLDFIGNGPRVMNLRFIRGSAESSTGIADGDMLDA
jgi:S1-C subfamily serine protease